MSEDMVELYEKKHELSLMIDGLEARLVQYLKHGYKHDISLAFMSHKCIELIIEYYDTTLLFMNISKALLDAKSRNEGYEKYTSLCKKLERIKKLKDNSNNEEGEKHECKCGACTEVQDDT